EAVPAGTACGAGPRRGARRELRDLAGGSLRRSLPPRALRAAAVRRKPPRPRTLDVASRAVRRAARDDRARAERPQRRRAAADPGFLERARRSRVRRRRGRAVAPAPDLD